MDIGILNAFMSAGIVNKMVFIILVCLSVYSWAIIIQKIKEMRKYKNTAVLVLEAMSINSNQRDEVSFALRGQKDDYASIIRFLQSAKNMTSKEDQAITMLYNSSLSKNIGFLATLANAAPFIGLFGTVLGVIHSFEQIGQTGSISLAVIAPGIAEALYATALGLFVAVPASITYNTVNSVLEKYEQEIGLIASHLSNL